MMKTVSILLEKLDCLFEFEQLRTNNLSYFDLQESSGYYLCKRVLQVTLNTSEWAKQSNTNDDHYVINLF